MIGFIIGFIIGGSFGFTIAAPSWWSAVMLMSGIGSCMMRTVIRRGMSIDE